MQRFERSSGNDFKIQGIDKGVDKGVDKGLERWIIQRQSENILI